MSRLKTLAAVVLAATLPAMAQAADFNLTGGSGTTATATFASGGIGLNVTGPSLGGSLDVTRSSYGLGVSTGLADLGGIGNNESLTLTFSQAVNLTSLKLAEWSTAMTPPCRGRAAAVTLVGDGIISAPTRKP
jgi:opacity protein-like surface antigen